MRKYIVTSFHCTRCCSELAVKYEKDVTKKPYFSTGSDGITGASKVENMLYVEPCEKCIQFAQKIVKTLKHMLDESDINDIMSNIENREAKK